MTLRWDRVHRGETGLTLAETLVATALFSVVMSMLTTLMITGLRVTRQTTSLATATDSARIAINQITTALRPAAIPQGQQTALVLADAKRISLYSSYRTIDLTAAKVTPSTPTLVSYDIVSGANGCATGDSCLLETLVPAGLAPRYRVLARNVDSSAAVFAYYVANTSGEVTTPLASMPLSADDLRQVDMVEVTLTVSNKKGTAGRPVVLTSRVWLPAAQYQAPS